MRIEKFRRIVLTVWLSSFCALALAQDREIRTERVEFPAGSTGTTINASLTGYEIVDYVVRAQADQIMVVEMKTDSGANYFNLMAPGETEVAFFNGSIQENSFSGPLSTNGDYTIRVYQMRSAARRNETASYTIDIEISPLGGGRDDSGSGDAMVAETEFHATGALSCARDSSQPMTQCEFGVVREGEGSGYLKIFWPDGGNRVVFFEDNTPSSFDKSQADGDAEMTVEKDSDLFKVEIGDQRFEFPDIVILGDNPY